MLSVSILSIVHLLSSRVVNLTISDTSLVNWSGGQAFVIKLRPTEERSPSSMLLEPPFTFNGSGIEEVQPPRWRQLKYVPFLYSIAIPNMITRKDKHVVCLICSIFGATSLSLTFVPTGENPSTCSNLQPHAVTCSMSMLSAGRFYSGTRSEAVVSSIGYLAEICFHRSGHNLGLPSRVSILSTPKKLKIDTYILKVRRGKETQSQTRCIL